MAKQKLHQDTQTQHDNQGLTQCLAEKDLLAKDNKILEVTLERLKQVLIDSELRAELSCVANENQIDTTLLKRGHSNCGSTSG